MTRYAIIRIPGNGPPALIAPPNHFATEAEAEARIKEVEAKQRMVHHTHLEVVAYAGGLTTALEKRGVLR